MLMSIFYIYSSEKTFPDGPPPGVLMSNGLIGMFMIFFWFTGLFALYRVRKFDPEVKKHWMAKTSYVLMCILPIAITVSVLNVKFRIW